MILSFLCASLKNVFRNLNYSLKKKVLLYFFIFSLFSSFPYVFHVSFFFTVFSFGMEMFFSFFILFANILFKKKKSFVSSCFIVFFCFFSFIFLLCFFRCLEPVFKNMEISLLCFLVLQMFFLPISFLKVFFRIMFPLFVFVTWVFESLLIVFPFVYS